MPEFPSDPTLDLPYAYGGAPLSGQLKVSPEDFQVDEILGYEATGEGDHAFLTIRKRGLNTQDVARIIQQHAGARQVDIGFAGLKDKHAITTQAFSVHLPGKDGPDWQALMTDQLEILDVQRHNRKIRRGSLRGNRFVLRIQHLQGDRTAAETVIEKIKKQGVPNYFGQQRFGRKASNLYRAEKFFNRELRRPKRDQIGMLLSASRSYLFNKVLAERVINKNWNMALSGDVMLLEGSNRQFLVEMLDDEIHQRVMDFDIHPSGPMPGDKGRSLQASDEAGLLEANILADELSQRWIEGIAQQRLDADRRSLRLLPKALAYEWQDNFLLMSFELTAGAYATSVMREIVCSS